MTFDEWWEGFVAEHDDWKYADSEALRRAAFQAGAASRDAEIEKLKLEIESSNFFEKQTAGERDQLRKDIVTQAQEEYGKREAIEVERDQLHAQINVLRESLEEAMYSNSTTIAKNKAKKALASAPEQSLAEYRNKVVDSIIAKGSELGVFTRVSGFADALAMDINEVVDSMPTDTLDHAMNQVNRTIADNLGKDTGV